MCKGDESPVILSKFRLISRLTWGYKIQAPEILSKIHWLGESTDVAMKVKAKEACQVLHLDRSKLLDLLSYLDDLKERAKQLFERAKLVDS